MLESDEKARSSKLSGFTFSAGRAWLEARLAPEIQAMRAVSWSSDVTLEALNF